MSAENKAMMQRFIEGVNAKDTGKIEQLISPDYVDHDLPPGQKPGSMGSRGCWRCCS